MKGMTGMKQKVKLLEIMTARAYLPFQDFGFTFNPLSGGGVVGKQQRTYYNTPFAYSCSRVSLYAITATKCLETYLSLRIGKNSEENHYIF